MTRSHRSASLPAASFVCTVATVAAVALSPAVSSAQLVPQSLRPDAPMQHAGSAPLSAPSSSATVGMKSAGTATLFSLLITGGGQLYNEETTKGVVMLTSGIAFTALALAGVDEYGCDPDEVCYPWMLPAGIGGALAVKIWSIADAAGGARRFNERHQIASLSLQPSVSVKPFGENKSVRLGVRGTF